MIHTHLKDRARKFSLSLDSLLFTHPETDFENPVWEAAPFHILIARLSPFTDVSESRPHLFLYDEVRSAMPSSYIDFAFFPKHYDIPVLEKQNLPFWYGIASGRGANEFDCILISNACTIELINIIPALEKSGIPARQSARNVETCPYILLGGSNALASGALLEIHDNTFIDAVPDGFFFGEGEHIAGSLVYDILKNHKHGLSSVEKKLQYFELVKKHTGYYHAGYNGTVKQNIHHEHFSVQHHYPVLASPTSNTVRLEISAGCPYFCNFCFEGFERKPYREIPFSTLLEQAKNLKTLSGADTIEISSYNFNTHTDIANLIEQLNSFFYRVNVMSQRVDILAEHQELIDFEFIADKRSYTLGIEGISERMRAYYNKELCFNSITKVIKKLLEYKAREIKLFYILSGFETDEDFNNFKQEIAAIKALSISNSYKPSILISTGYLVRMPGTPLAYEELMLDESRLENLAEQLQNITKTLGFDFRAPHYFDEYTVTQILALASHTILDLLITLYKQAVYYDGSLSKKAYSVIKNWLNTTNFLTENFLKEKDANYKFPFYFVERPVSTEFLYRRFLNSKQHKEEKTCFTVSSENSFCKGCNACIDNNEKQSLTNHMLKKPTSKNKDFLITYIKKKQKPYSIAIVYSIPKGFAYAPKEYIEAIVIKQLLTAYPELTTTILSANDTLLKVFEDQKQIVHPYGTSIVMLTFIEKPSIDIADQLTTLHGAIEFQNQCLETPSIQFFTVTMQLATDQYKLIEHIVSNFLQTEAIPFTLQRKNNITQFAISEKGKKKKNILDAVLTMNTDHCLITLTGGSKLDCRTMIALLKKHSIPAECFVEWDTGF